MKRWFAVTCAMWILSARGACLGRGQAPPCLPKRDARRVGRAGSRTEALLIYAKLANKELSRQKYLSEHYRPWQESGPLSGGGLGEAELEIADCAYRAIFAELAGPGTQGSLPKKQLLTIEHELALGFVHLEDAMAWAPPEIERHLQTTRALLEDAETVVRTQLHRPRP